MHFVFKKYFSNTLEKIIEISFVFDPLDIDFYNKF